MSAGATEWAYNESFAHGYHPKSFQEFHRDALFYYLAAQELGCVGLHTDIMVGDEISAEALAAYDKYLHDSVFPPANRSSVTALVGDGHCKVLTKCDAAPSRAGRPRSGKQPRRFTNGWFMLACPRSGRVLCVEQMREPENNAVVTKSLEKVLPCTSGPIALSWTGTASTWTPPRGTLR